MNIKIRNSKTLIIILSTTAVIFILMVMTSNETNTGIYNNFMKSLFGYTNRWSRTFGPDWFVELNTNISALSSQLVFLITSAFTLLLLYLLKQKKMFEEFYFMIVGAMVLLFILKLSLNDEQPDSIINVLLLRGLSFPSGHTMSSIVLYLSLATFANRRIRFDKAKILINIFTIFLILIIGLSRLFVGAHTPQEVIAGWCGGLFWFSIVDYFYNKKRKYHKNNFRN